MRRSPFERLPSTIVTNEPDNSTGPDRREDPYRKLIRSMILVFVLMACAALLLALGQCARRRDQPLEQPKGPTRVRFS